MTVKQLVCAALGCVLLQFPLNSFSSDFGTFFCIVNHDYSKAQFEGGILGQLKPFNHDRGILRPTFQLNGFQFADVREGELEFNSSGQTNENGLDSTWEFDFFINNEARAYLEDHDPKTVVVFLSGHGKRQNGKDYLILPEPERGKPSGMKVQSSKTLDIETFVKRFDNLFAKKEETIVVYYFNCCREGNQLCPKGSELPTGTRPRSFMFYAAAPETATYAGDADAPVFLGRTCINGECSGWTGSPLGHSLSFFASGLPKCVLDRVVTKKCKHLCNSYYANTFFSDIPLVNGEDRFDFPSISRDALSFVRRTDDRFKGMAADERYRQCSENYLATVGEGLQKLLADIEKDKWISSKSYLCFPLTKDRFEDWRTSKGSKFLNVPSLKSANHAQLEMCLRKSFEARPLNGDVVNTLLNFGSTPNSSESFQIYPDLLTRVFFESIWIVSQSAGAVDLELEVDNRLAGLKSRDRRLTTRDWVREYMTIAFSEIYRSAAL